MSVRACSNTIGHARAHACHSSANGTRVSLRDRRKKPPYSVNKCSCLLLKCRFGKFVARSPLFCPRLYLCVCAHARDSRANGPRILFPRKARQVSPFPKQAWSFHRKCPYFSLKCRFRLGRQNKSPLVRRKEAAKPTRIKRS